MRYFKNWPICKKHGNTYSQRTGCLNCKKEQCQCVGKRVIEGKKCKGCGKSAPMKRLDEVFEEMEREGMIPKC